jgi:cellulose biosynthesis protein BcsQ
MTQGPPNEPGKVIAFYSFKGGTGRSMALANIACLLAQAGAGSILMVDWDLEAPGLHRYFRKHLFKAFRGLDEVQDKFPGLIDLFIDLRNTIEDFDDCDSQDHESASTMLQKLVVEDYIIPTDINGLHLLKAGKFDYEYPARVGRFDWPKLYERSPFLLRAFADRLARTFRYVLIDSPQD